MIRCFTVKVASVRSLQLVLSTGIPGGNKFGIKKEEERIRKLIASSACLLLSANAFVFGGPVEPGPFNPFGVLFLFLAVLVWRQWHLITGNHALPLWDGFGRSFIDRSGIEPPRE